MAGVYISRGHAYLAEVFTLRGTAYAAKLECDRAIADFDQALRYDRYNVKAVHARDAALLATGQGERAAAGRAKAASDFVVYENFFVGTHQFDRAIKIFDEAIRLDPGNTDAVRGRDEAIAKRDAAAKAKGGTP